jgi:hypothetical protein
MTTRIEPSLLCYRLDSSMSYDEEAIWSFVQRHGGLLSIRGDCIDFWIPMRYQSMFVCAWSGLRRMRDLDYI